MHGAGARAAIGIRDLVPTVLLSWRSPFMEDLRVDARSRAGASTARRQLAAETGAASLCLCTAPAFHTDMSPTARDSLLAWYVQAFHATPFETRPPMTISTKRSMFGSVRAVLFASAILQAVALGCSPAEPAGGSGGSTPGSGGASSGGAPGSGGSSSGGASSGGAPGSGGASSGGAPGSG